MARIPTPIPESAVANVRAFFRGTAVDVLWKAFVLVMLGLLLLALAAASPGFFVAFVIGAVLSAVLSDDIRAIVSDVWHRNFWTWRT